MNQTFNKVKSRAYLIIMGAFIIGVVTGSLLMNLVMANSPSSKKPSLVEELTSELNLSPEQKKKVELIFIESRQRGKEVLKSIQPQMDHIREQTKAHVTNVLDREQQMKYEKWSALREADKKKTGERK